MYGKEENKIWIKCRDILAAHCESDERSSHSISVFICNGLEGIWVFFNNLCIHQILFLMFVKKWKIKYEIWNMKNLELTIIVNPTKMNWNRPLKPNINMTLKLRLKIKWSTTSKRKIFFSMGFDCTSENEIEGLSLFYFI